MLNKKLLCCDCEYLTKDYTCGRSTSGLTVIDENTSLMSGIFMIRNSRPEWCPLTSDWTRKDTDVLAKELDETVRSIRN